jgi:CPA1 family monovalent cation:H+ antiporter
MASSLALAIAGLAAVVLLNAVARLIRVPAAVVLVAAGLVYGVLPGPNLTLRPDLILNAVIPPLLYSAALNSSAIALARNKRAIASLSVGLVAKHQL